MQENYLGNNQDYVKFALLWHIHCETRLRIGVNWYLNPGTPASPKEDERSRKYLTDSSWKFLDPALLKILAIFKDKDKRKIKCVPKMGILPKGTLYFEEQITGKDRSDWHGCAKESCLKKADLIFLDPNTGFQTSDDEEPRHALYSEAFDWLAMGKHVVTYQVLGHCKPKDRVAKVRCKLKKYAKEYGVEMADLAPVIRGRSTTNVLFVTISPKSKADEGDALNAALESFVPQICDREDCRTTDCTRKKCKIKLVR